METLPFELMEIVIANIPNLEFLHSPVRAVPFAYGVFEANYPRVSTKLIDGLIARTQPFCIANIISHHDEQVRYAPNRQCL